MGDCFIFSVQLKYQYIYIVLEWKIKTIKETNAAERALFPALLEAGILIVELAGSSQVLNTLSLLSSRLLSSHGELIWV